MGAILIAIVMVFFGRVAMLLARGEADLGMKDILEPLGYLRVRGGLIGLTVLYTVAIDWGGFTLTSFAFMAIAMVMLNRGAAKGRCLLVAPSMAIAGYLLFILAFGIRFPKGPFEMLMDAVL